MKAGNRDMLYPEEDEEERILVGIRRSHEIPSGERLHYGGRYYLSIISQRLYEPGA
jgi:hypothetical protein